MAIRNNYWKYKKIYDSHRLVFSTFSTEKDQTNTQFVVRVIFICVCLRSVEFAHHSEIRSALLIVRTLARVYRYNIYVYFLSFFLSFFSPSLSLFSRAFLTSVKFNVSRFLRAFFRHRTLKWKTKGNNKEKTKLAYIKRQRVGLSSHSVNTIHWRCYGAAVD